MPKWFESWFDTEFYHLLYNNRDEAEAEGFVKNLCIFLKLHPGAALADVACGKGRHCRVLASLGHHVLGMDISQASIDYANSLSGTKEQYAVHDMRKPFPAVQLDAAFNLFTSFGYFETEEEDLSALQNVLLSLKPGGVFVQDYLNPAYTLSNLKTEETVFRGDVKFEIHRYEQNGCVKKDIRVTQGAEISLFQESVKLYSAADFHRLHTNAGFRVINTFGDYSLNPFDEKTSPRIILVSEKP